MKKVLRIKSNKCRKIDYIMIPLIIQEYLVNKRREFLMLCSDYRYYLQTRRQIMQEISSVPLISLKTYIKHMAIGSLISSLIALGSVETYHLYYGKRNLTLCNYNNHTWLDNVYANIPFNELEYNNLTNLLSLPQSYQVQKVNDILFSGLKDNYFDWESELTRLKINDLTAQIPLKRRELGKLIAETKNKFSKAESYLLERLLDEKPNSEKLNELQVALSDRKAETEIILNKKRELRDLEKHLEQLQAIQLEAKVEVN